MLQFINRMPIFRRFFIMFVIMAIVPGIVIALLSNVFLTSLNTRSQAVQTSVDSQSTASQEQGNLQRMHEELQTRFDGIFASLQGGIADPALAHAGGLVSADIAAREAEFGQALQTYQANYDLTTSSNMTTVRTILTNDNPTTGPAIIIDQQQALNDVVTTQWPAYQHLLDQEAQLLDGVDPTLNGHPTARSLVDLNRAFSKSYTVLWHAIQAFTALQNDWQRVVDDAAVTSKTVTTVGQSETQPITIGAILASVVIIVMSLLIGVVLNLTIVNPLRSLSALTRRIARGDRSARARIHGRDEIAIVGRSMNNMLDNIVHLIQETQAQHDSLQAQVEKLVGEVSGVGEGDLRVQAEVTTDALGVLADSFNYMVEELGSLVVRVKMVAQEVENSTMMTFERMSQLVESADTQIKQIVAAAGEVERLSSLSRQVADRAQSLYAIAREARQTAQTGRASVLQTVEGMGRINSYVQETSTKVLALGDSSSEIDSIVTVIANIAHQTNRLALDAAIQAAMAGDNGKGFSAVAADIRRLAERSKDQASQIARIVRSVREDIGAATVSMEDTKHETSIGAELAQEAGSALDSIFSVVERQGREIESINQMAAQQFQSSNTIVQIMHSVSASTQRSSHSTRDAAQNMDRLARLAEQLLASVEAFKLRDNLNNYSRANITVTPQEQHDNYLTVSGVFRTVTATAQRDTLEHGHAALAPVGVWSPQQFQPVPSPNGTPPTVRTWHESHH